MTEIPPAELTPEEGALLSTMSGERRRVEWRRGRLACRAVLDSLGVPVASVLADADGAPRADGAAISLSHDAEWVAVAASTTAHSLGIDVCSRSHAERIRKILSWLGVATNVEDPVAVWAALEAGLKLRRLGVEALRDRELAVIERGGAIELRGLGATISIEVQHAASYVVAWTVAP